MENQYFVIIAFKWPEKKKLPILKTFIIKTFHEIKNILPGKIAWYIYYIRIHGKFFTQIMSSAYILHQGLEDLKNWLPQSKRATHHYTHDFIWLGPEGTGQNF